jgi:hypothetical protein
MGIFAARFAVIKLPNDLTQYWDGGAFGAVARPGTALVVIFNFRKAEGTTNAVPSWATAFQSPAILRP